MLGWFKRQKKQPLAEESEQIIINEAVKFNETAFMAVDTEPETPGAKAIGRRLRNAVADASVKGLRAGLLAFFESLSSNIKKGLK